MTTQSFGRPTGGKPINLVQLEQELAAAQVAIGSGIGLQASAVFTYDADGASADFADGQQALADQVIGEHVAMRDRSSAEYAAEFQDPNTSTARKQEIRDIQSGLLPPEQVAITQEEWDTQMGLAA
jgi:hypothetical protein